MEIVVESDLIVDFQIRDTEEKFPTWSLEWS